MPQKLELELMLSADDVERVALRQLHHLKCEVCPETAVQDVRLQLRAIDTCVSLGWFCKACAESIAARVRESIGRP